ncbi:uncharacterized protein with PQ loop repeat [Anaeroplasma bactoclasticum]|jgi:uncharacterized protein with PQ loop repeat|uniref:Uncharacterized protein with PQ loop repeat n=1 Tax=Anaeroplasma bactoclasticum TaxID=2088 RepID=A0A397R403_9MOLU|nr:SemiSWEET family transporter [Anaeroplasma bactoclasticum]RIA64904.1 uncharacterized protein with PQ loop repeat [Anaeroplasma bactoclasticum]
MDIFFEVISYIAGISLAISAVPQIIVIIKERSVRGVSLFTMLLLMIGNYAWLAYGIYHHIISMIVFDSISGTLFLIVSLLKIIDNIKQTKNKQIAS